MTLAEIRASGKDFLIPSDIAPILECDPQYIRIMAREQPALLGFPVMVIGRRTRIPRVPFLKFMGG